MVLWRQDNSIFTPPGRIDSWVYLGFFRNLVNFKRDLFPNTYYGSRLTWLLPGHLIYSIFSPVTAAFVLHLSVLWVAMLSLFSTLRLTVGARSAFLTTIVFAANPQIWGAIGSDYVDGVIIAYCLLAMALLTGAALRPEPAWRLILAGGAIACLIYVNFFWVSLTPLLLLQYVVLAWLWRQRSAGRSIADVCMWCGVGFLAVTLACCAVNYWLDGTVWFYAPSLQRATSVMQDNPWYLNPWTSRGPVPWLWFTGVAALTGMAVVLFRWRRRESGERTVLLLSSAQLFAALTLFLYLQYAQKVAVLAWPYYASYLLPFAFLVIGSAYWRGASAVSQRSFVWSCGLAVVLFGVIWADYGFRYFPVWPSAFWPVILFGAATLSAALTLRNRTAASLCAIAGFACLTSECQFGSNAQIPKGTDAATVVATGPHIYGENLDRIMQIRSRIEAVRQDRPVHFWYNERNLSSTTTGLSIQRI